MASQQFSLAARRWILKRMLTLPALAAPQLAWPQAAPRPDSLANALNVMDFEALARAVLPPAHFGHIATGADDDLTVLRNHEAFGLIQMRARRFVDVSNIDMSTRVLGADMPLPLYLSPIGSQRAFHPDGERATAQAAASKSVLMMLSSAASTSVETVTEARGAPVWMQLYPTDDWNVTKALVLRAQRAGCTAIVLTVDQLSDGRNRETFARQKQLDTRVCGDCHINNDHNFVKKAPMYSGIDISRVKRHTPANMEWSYLDRLRDLVSVKLLVKGIVAGEDAALCVQHGADGVVVSNHGGRSDETLRSTIECLPEVGAAVAGRVPVLLDGGVRRGTDVFKALALGASAVGIGRPQVWGLAAGGKSGVEAVVDILARETRTAMQQAGAPNVRAIRPAHVVSHLT